MRYKSKYCLHLNGLTWFLWEASMQALKGMWFILVGEHLWSFTYNPSSCLGPQLYYRVLWDNLGFKAWPCHRVAIKKGLTILLFLRSWHPSPGLPSIRLCYTKCKGDSTSIVHRHMWAFFYMSLNQVLIDMTLATFNCILYIPLTPLALHSLWGSANVMLISEW